MKSQADMNQLHEQNLHKQKGKEGIGYKGEGESSKQGTQNNPRPTCNHCGKIGHTSNKCWSNGKSKFNGNATTIINMVTSLMNAKRNQNLKVTIINARNMDTRHHNAKQRH